MAEEFDVVFIGAGHNALVCAAYLAKAGLKTINLERMEVPGGGLSTEEITLPGFKHVTHSNMHGWIHLGPVYKELEVEKYHKYIFPSPTLAMPFLDGRSILFYSGKGMEPIERTCKTIEQFSKRDSKTYMDIYKFHQEFGQFARAWFFSPPMPLSQTYSLLEGTHGGREVMRLMLTTPSIFVDELFESEEVKAFLLALQLQATGGCEEFGSGLLILLDVTLQHDPGWALSVGGSLTLALALKRIVEDYGGKILLGSQVERILIKNGVSIGVETKDGKKIMAKKAVVSNIDPKSTFLNLVGDEYLKEEFIKQVKRYRPGMSAIVPHYALNEPPIYKKAEEREPDVRKAWGVFVCESCDALLKFYRDIHGNIELRRPEDTMFLEYANTRWDPSQAPEGKHTAFFWLHQPYNLKEGGSQRWEEIKEEVVDITEEQWRRFAPNMNKDNILKRHVDSPLDLERRMPQLIKGCWLMGAMDQDQLGMFRPFHGYPPYRTPIENLYMCGSCTHPGGGISGSPGYNAAGAICDDLKVKRWWSPLTI